MGGTVGAIPGAGGRGRKSLNAPTRISRVAGLVLPAHLKRRGTAAGRDSVRRAYP